MENAQKQIKIYQKEINLLKQKLENLTGYNKIVELENKLKESELKIIDQNKEIRILKEIQKREEKDINKTLIEQDFEKKIQNITEMLKNEKIRNRELEKKLLEEQKSNIKLHALIVELQEKNKKSKNELNETKCEHRFKEKKEDSNEEKYKEDIEKMQNLVKSIQRQLEKERIIFKRNTNLLKSEVNDLKQKLEQIDNIKSSEYYKLRSRSRALKMDNLTENCLEKRKEHKNIIIRIHKNRPSKSPLDIVFFIV